MRTYSALVYFTATFRVQCELCDEVYSFEQEFCGTGSGGTSPKLAQEKAHASAAEQLARLRSGDLGAVEPRRCPACGYSQSWMLPAEASRRFTPLLVGWGSLIGMGLILLLSLLNEPIEKLLLYLPPVLLAIVAGVVGLGVSIRRHRAFDPNVESLRDLPRPDARLPQVTFRDGRQAARPPAGGPIGKPEVPSRGDCCAALNRLYHEFLELDRGMTVEALGHLEERGLLATYEHLCQRLESLLREAESMPLDRLAKESQELVAEGRRYLRSLDEPA